MTIQFTRVLSCLNLIVKFCLEHPNKSKSETLEYFKLLKFQKLTIYRKIKRFEKQENVEKKISFGQKCALLKIVKKQTADRNVKLYCELMRKIQVDHNTVKKYLAKMEVHCKAEISSSKTTARQESVIQARCAG
jgi:DNA polymerase III alpha subunit (gram-positive type)